MVPEGGPGFSPAVIDPRSQWALAPEVQDLNFSGTGSKTNFLHADPNGQSSGRSTKRFWTGFI
jgi:hypothetical protein